MSRSTALRRCPPVVSPFRSSEAREAERQEKREAVLLAAVRMFNEHGFHTTSLDDVAASLGVTKPVIYRYLGNKDQVLLECLTRGAEQLCAAAAEVRAGPGTGLDRLETLLRRYAEIIMSDFGTCVIRTEEASLSSDSARRFRSLKRKIDTALRRQIEEGIADGTVAAADVRMTAFALAGALNWSAVWYRPDRGLSAAEIAGKLVEALAAGLCPRALPGVDAGSAKRNDCRAGNPPSGRKKR